MSKLFTLLLIITSTLAVADTPPGADYGKLLLIEEREMKPHFEWGVDGGVALDNASENVYSLSGLLDYVASPLWSFGAEITVNKTEDKDYLKRLQASGDIKVTSYTPDWFGQLTARFHLIKGHLNLLNKIQTPFEMSLVGGAGVAYNSELSKSSSLFSWGGEFLIPVTKTYKAALGIRHFKTYAFQKDELSYTNLLLGVRSEF